MSVCLQVSFWERQTLYLTLLNITEHVADLKERVTRNPSALPLHRVDLCYYERETPANLIGLYLLIKPLINN